MLKAELFSDADQLQGVMLFTSRAAKNGMHTGFGLERRCRKSARISGCVAGTPTRIILIINDLRECVGVA